MAMAEGEDVRRDVRYRVGRWLGATLPSGIFGVLLLGSFGFPLATWLEWLQGGPGEPLGVEVAMLLAWLLCALLAYAWWFSARLGTAESGGRDERRFRFSSLATGRYRAPATPATVSPMTRKRSASANRPPGSADLGGGPAFEPSSSRAPTDLEPSSGASKG